MRKYGQGGCEDALPLVSFSPVPGSPLIPVLAKNVHWPEG